MSALASSSLSIVRLLPADDLAEFSRLPDPVQRLVMDRLPWIAEIDRAMHRAKGQLVQRAARALRVDVGSINRYLAKFRKQGWRGLIDKRSAGVVAKGLPARFRESIAAESCVHQRLNDDGREIRRFFLDRWQLWTVTGDPQYRLDGYDFPPPPNPATGYPHGWSEENFRRHVADARAKALGKLGEKAAAKFLPSVQSTRVGCRFLQVVMFDDQDYDRKVWAAGLSTPARPVGFNALDYLTGAFLDYHLRLLYTDDVEQRKKTLTVREFTWFVVRLLMLVGYRTDDVGTSLIFEHGTANAFSNKELITLGGHHSFAEAVHHITGGKVTVARSGLYNTPAVSGMMFSPRSSGNPNAKAALESLYHLVRTVDQRLIGQTGRRYDLAPAELHGLEKYEKELAAAATKLDPYHAGLLRHTMLEFGESAQLYRALYRAINARTDHAIEGWEACGFTRLIWRWDANSEQWFNREDLDDMPEHLRAHALHVMERNPHCVRRMKLSPEQALRRLEKDSAIVRLPDHAVPLLIPREWAQLRPVNANRTVTIQDPLHKTDRYLQFPSFFINPAGNREYLPTGKQVLCYLNPFDCDQLYVCSENGAFLGTLVRPPAGIPLDLETQVKALEIRSIVKADSDAEFRLRAATIVEERKSMRDHNARIMAGEPVTDEEIAQTRSASAHKAATTRRVKAWQDDVSPEQCTAAADALQPDCSPVSPSISHEQIGEWLND